MSLSDGMYWERDFPVENKSVKKIYAVYANSDMTEGRGPMVFVCAYDNPSAAMEHIRSASGVMGYNNPSDVKRDKFGHYAYGNSHYVDEVTLLSGYADYKQQMADADRARALAKLSQRERELLGVS